MKRTLALILTVMMVLCMIPASLLSALANGPGVGVTDPPNLSLQAGNGTYIPETVQVDGVLDDTGWDTDGWFEVNSATGTWDVGTPRNNNFEYEYQLHRNETFFYGAYSINADSIFNGSLSEITVWLNDGSVSDKYTQKVVINTIDTANGTAAMTVYNGETSVTDPTDMSGENPTAKNDYYTVSDSTRIAVKATTVDGVNMIVVEFRVRMDNFASDFRLTEKITAFSQVKLSGTTAESLYYPRLATTQDNLMVESPDSVWPANAHEVTKADVTNVDGTADYNNVLPTDINIDGRFTEGGWVNLTDRYSAMNEDGIGYSIDDYRRTEDYDNGYVADISDVDYSGTVAYKSTSAFTNGDSTPSNFLSLKNDYLRFKYNVGLNKNNYGGYSLNGALVTFADGMIYQSTDLWCYVIIRNASNVPQGVLEIMFDASEARAGAAVQYKTYYYNKSELASGIGSKTATSSYGGAKRQTYSRYLVNFEFSIPLTGSGLISSADLSLVSDWDYIIEVSATRYTTSSAITTAATMNTVRDNRTNGYWANSSVGGDWPLFPTTVTRHYNDSEPNGELSKDTYQSLNAADPYIDGASGYQGAWTNSWANIRQNTNYYYEVYADYDYVYGAAIINSTDGWAESTDGASADAFTLWVYNNTVTDQQYYNFAISFYNTAVSTNTFDGTKTSWDVSAWYKNAASNSPLAGVNNVSGASLYSKGDKQIAGIEAVMRRLDKITDEDKTTGTSIQDDGYYNDSSCILLEFKIPVSLLYYDQSAGADAYSPAIAFGYYTSISRGGVSSLNEHINLGSATIAHPMGNNHGAGLDCDWDSNDATELMTYDPDIINDTGKTPMQSHYLPSGYRWAGPDDLNADGDTSDKYETLDSNGRIQWVTSYEVNDRVFDPKRVYAETCRQIRSDDSNDGWRFGRVIDNFKPDGKLEEVYWNQDEELIAVNGETGYWDNLPDGNTDFNYGYRVYTGREYVYGGIKVNATGIQELEYIDNLTGDERTAAIERNNAIIAENNKIIENTKINIWFNSAESDSGNTNATHRFTFWLVDSVTAKCEAVDLVSGLDMPLSGTVLEEGFATSGTEETYVRYEVTVINNEIVVEFMIDLDLLNLNNTRTGYMDYARDGYEYVVGVTHTVEGENVSLYHLDDTKTFWMTGYGTTVDNAISQWEVAPSAGMVIPKGTGCAYGVPSTAYVIGFNPTEYDGVYAVSSVLKPGTLTKTTGWGSTSELQLSLEDGGFAYVFNPGTTSGEGVADITSSYATDRGVSNIADFTTVGALIKFENLVLDTTSLEYTKNEATYTYCGYANFDSNDTTYPYHIVDGLPNENHTNAHLKQIDTGYISVPQYSVFTANAESVLPNTPANSWGTASPALEVTYLNDYITDKIYVDGLLNDQGWATADWTTVNETINGNRQTVAHTSGKQNADGSYQNEFKVYEYAVRTDDEYFYVGAKIYMPIDGVYSDGTEILDKSGNPVYPTLRLWVNNDLDGDRNSFTKLYDLEAGAKYSNTLTFDFSEYDIDSRTNYYKPDVIAENSTIITSPDSYTNIAGETVTDATVVSNGDGTISLTYNNYHVRVSDNLFPLNPNGGSADPHYTLAEGSDAGKMTKDQNYRQSSFYGETVVVEENAYNGYDYDDASDTDSWVAERHLKSITYGSEHATMREDPTNHNITLVEYKIKLSELVNDEGAFEYGFHCSALGSGDGGNDYLFFYPMVVKEVAQDISKYDRFHMPMWFWSNTSLVYNEEVAGDIMMKSTYTPVTEIGADAYTLEDGDILDSYYSYTYNANTSAIRLGAYYDHDYIERFMRDQGIYNYPDWDYWDVYEMGVLIFPAHGMTTTDANGNTVQADHDEFLNVTAEDRYYKLSKGVKNVEADLIENHQGNGSRFCDYENFVFYAAMVLSPEQAAIKAYNNLKYSYRGYVDFYGNDLYNDEFEGWPSETDAFLQYYYNQDELYKADTFVEGIREDIYVNNNADANHADGLSFGGNGFDADKSVLNSEAQKTIKLPNLANLDLEKYGLTEVPDVLTVELGESYKDPADGSFTLKRFSLADYALYDDYYSDSMIRSVEIVREIASRKGVTADTNANRVDQDTAGVYYVPATWDPIGDGRVTHLANSAGYNLYYTEAEDTTRAVVYVDGTNITVDSVTALANTANVVATTDNADTAASLEAAGITTVYNADKNTLGMLGMAALVSEYYGKVSVDVDYYGSVTDIAADKAIIDPMLSSVGVKNSNVANSLNILVLSTAVEPGTFDADKANYDYNDNLLTKLADNLAANVPTVVIDMTGNDGLTYNDTLITPITETMHLARLLGYSSMPVATEAAAIGIAQGVARYAYLSGVKSVVAESNTAFLKSLTYSLVNDIAYNDCYIPDATEGASGTVTGVVTAPKTAAFQVEAEKITNQLNGSGILVWIDAEDGNESENANACVLVGYLSGSDKPEKVLWGDEASFEMLITSGVNIARQNYSVGKTGATIAKTSGNYDNWDYTVDEWVGGAWQYVEDSSVAKNNDPKYLLDGETTTKVWDFLLPDALNYESSYEWTATAPANTVPGYSDTSLYLSEAQAVGRLNVERGLQTENRWIAVGNTGTITLTLAEATTNLSAIRVHLGASSAGYVRKPGLFMSYSTDGTNYTEFGSGTDNRIYTIESVRDGGLDNFTYWATLNLAGLQGTGVKYIKLRFAGDDNHVSLVDEIEVYTAPSATATGGELDVGTFNVGHCENLNGSSGTAFGMFYTSGGNTAGGTIKWANYSNANTTVEDVYNVGKFIGTAGGSDFDVMFIQEAAQYIGSDGGSHIWGNCNQMKLLSDYSGYEYYTYATGNDVHAYLHGAEAAVDDDPTTLIDNASVGVGILSKYPIVASGSYSQQNGQVISWARINVNGKYVDVFSTHFDSNQYRTYDKYMMRHKLYQGLKRVTENSDTFILGGDFNEVYLHTFEVVSKGSWTPVLDMRAYVDYDGVPWYELSGTDAYTDFAKVEALKDNVNEYYLGVEKTADSTYGASDVVYSKLYTLSRHRKIVDNILWGGDMVDASWLEYENIGTYSGSGAFSEVSGTSKTYYNVNGDVASESGIRADTIDPYYGYGTTNNTYCFNTADHSMLRYKFNIKP